MIIDYNKVKRVQEPLAVELDNKFHKDLYNNEISFILFDGKKGYSRILTESKGRCFSCFVKEEHYSAVIQPSGENLFQFVPDKIDH